MTAPERGPRFGGTLFSFTNELLAAAQTPDELLGRVLRSGLVGPIEIDGAQHFRSFPLLDPDEVRATARVVAAASGAVSVLGGGPDLTPAPGLLRDAETVHAQLESQIRAARILGAEAVRIPFGVLPWPVLQGAGRIAEREGVLLLEEVQGPATPRSPAVAQRVEDLSAADEPALGLLLDTSVLMGGLPPTYVEALAHEGLSSAVLDRLAEAFAARRVAPEVLPMLADPAVSAAARGPLITAMTRFGHGAAADWLPLASWIRGVHVKWWDLDSAANELAGETGLLLEGLLAAGFRGTVCSEWGGHEWMTSEADTAALLAAHARLLGERCPVLLPAAA
ncbi:MAG TPA: hypothetical protein VIG76_10655 [Amnibacterium sp.]|uniref:hypothetical protein n=1 Tax=Amnibacterium sp. TaxID=1872496 RepID=UPI002F91E275